MIKSKLKSICVFCGSSSGKGASFEESAKRLGKLFAENQIQLIYGGAQVGLMGTVADACIENGGRVIGVIPKGLCKKEIAHSGLTELIVVKDMHERKAKMASLADAFVALPGGLGTLEELFEVLTWAQLGIHQKPIGLLNTDSYFQSLLNFLNTVAQSGFMSDKHSEILLVESNAEKLLSKLENFEVPEFFKWMSEDET